MSTGTRESVTEVCGNNGGAITGLQMVDQLRRVTNFMLIMLGPNFGSATRITAIQRSK